MKVTVYLKISEYLSLPTSQCIMYLKEAKADYLLHKNEQRKLRDEYIDSLQSKEVKKKRNNEKIKLRWKILKKYFGKDKSKSILAVEYSQKGCTIRVSS